MILSKDEENPLIRIAEALERIAHLFDNISNPPITIKQTMNKNSNKFDTII